MRKFASTLIILLLVLTAAAALAQDDTVQPPPELNVALEDLSQRVGVTLGLNSVNYRWEGQRFNDASLGCPQPGEVYAQVITPGWQFLIEYRGTLYDYRVAEGGGSVVLCETSPATQPSLTPIPLDTSTPVPTLETAPCGPTIVVADNDTLIDIADRCNTTVGAIVDANPDLQTRSEIIFAGETLQLPTAPPTAPPSDPQDNAIVTIYPLSGPAGSAIELIANRFPPNTDVNIGIGRVASEYDVFQTATTDALGGLNITVTVPDFVTPDDEWVFVVETPDLRIEAISAVFDVTP